jgi:hypothetical protein
VLKIAHINICSLRNKVHEVNNFLETDYIHILTLSETHLAIHGYYIYRKYRNANGGDVAVYIQNHIPVKLRGSHVKYCLATGSSASPKAQSCGKLLSTTKTASGRYV